MKSPHRHRAQGPGAPGAPNLAHKKGPEYSWGSTPQHRRNMAVKEGTANGQGLINARDDHAALEQGWNAANQFRRTPGKVGKGLARYPAFFSPRLPQAHDGPGFPVGNGVDADRVDDIHTWQRSQGASQSKADRAP